MSTSGYIRVTNGLSELSVVVAVDSIRAITDKSTMTEKLGVIKFKGVNDDFVLYCKEDSIAINKAVSSAIQSTGKEMIVVEAK